jgi:Fe-S-cluster-containing dehydrogenase component
MQKCDYCTGAGREPACTEACPAGALYSGPLDTLPEKAKGKNAERMDGDNRPSIILTG